MFFMDTLKQAQLSSVPEYVAFPRITPYQIIDTTTEIIDTIAKYVIIIYRNAYEKNLAFIDIV